MIFLVCLFFTSGFLDSSEKKELSHGGSLYNGRKQVLYFADALSEVAFVVPNLPEAKTSSSETCECTPPPPLLGIYNSHKLDFGLHITAHG